MPPIRLGPKDLLIYNSTYKVLICTDCQVGIQPSALSSHLLRHKIYRGDRDALLTAIAKLELVEPDNVIFPSPSSSAIPHLPLDEGYRCDLDGCGSLLISEKRMRRHWCENHREEDGQPIPDLDTYTTPAKIQSFFRGTKVRYFQVQSRRGPTASTSRTPQQRDHLHRSPSPIQPEPSASLAAALPVASSSSSSPANIQALLNGPSSPVLPFNTAEYWGFSDEAAPQQAQEHDPPSPPPTAAFPLDLRSLTYLHHFTSKTIHTLPQATLWREQVVPAALEEEWSASGILALAACHMAWLAEDPATKEEHSERAAQLGAVVRRHYSTNETAGRDPRTRLLGYLLGLLQNWSSILMDWKGVIVSDPILEISGLLRVCSWLARPDGDELDNHLQPNAAHSYQALDDPRPLPASHTTPPRVSALIRELPFNMAMAFDKPEAKEDFLAVMASINALEECCKRSYGPETEDMGCVELLRWGRRMPEHMSRMVVTGKPEALVVVAHWLSIMATRAKECGCWYLQGPAERALTKITRTCLPQGNVRIQQIVCGLLE